MEITGKLIKILPEIRGESQRGPWVRGGFVIETDGDYPRTVAFTTFGEERLTMVASIPLNSLVTVTFSPESREYQERWYTDLRCSRIQSFAPGQMPPTSTGYAWPAAAPAPTPTPTPTPVQGAAPTNQTPFATPLKPDEDLPF